MGRKDVIVLNSHGVGQYAYTDHMPKWGESLSVKKWHIAEDGGKGSNVAVALGRLGVDTAYIGKVGNDPWGDLGEKWLENAGVDYTYMYRSDEISTGTGLVLIGPDGQNSIIDGEGSSVALTQEEVFNALDDMKDSKYFITGFEIPTEIALKSAEYAKRIGMITVLNPSPLPDKKVGMMKYIDYLFINEVEAKYMCDEMQNKDIDLEKLVFEVKEKYDVGKVIMTLGSKGSMALDGDKVIKILPVKVENVVNTAGAGDGFMAAVIAGLVKGKKLEDAMTWATYYAALSVTIDGTIPAYRPVDEVERFIEEHS